MASQGSGSGTNRFTRARHRASPEAVRSAQEAYKARLESRGIRYVKVLAAVETHDLLRRVAELSREDRLHSDHLRLLSEIVRHVEDGISREESLRILAEEAGLLAGVSAGETAAAPEVELIELPSSAELSKVIDLSEPDIPDLASAALPETAPQADAGFPVDNPLEVAPTLDAADEAARPVLDPAPAGLDEGLEAAPSLDGEESAAAAESVDGAEFSEAPQVVSSPSTRPAALVAVRDGPDKVPPEDEPGAEEAAAKAPPRERRQAGRPLLGIAVLVAAAGIMVVSFMTGTGAESRPQIAQLTEEDGPVPPGALPPAMAAVELGAMDPVPPSENTEETTADWPAELPDIPDAAEEVPQDTGPEPSAVAAVEVEIPLETPASVVPEQMPLLLPNESQAARPQPFVFPPEESLTQVAAVPEVVEIGSAAVDAAEPSEGESELMEAIRIANERIAELEAELDAKERLEAELEKAAASAEALTRLERQLEEMGRALEGTRTEIAALRDQRDDLQSRLDAIEQREAAEKAAATAGLRVVPIRRGETLRQAASRYNTPLRKIYDVNGPLAGIHPDEPLGEGSIYIPIFD